MKQKIKLAISIIIMLCLSNHWAFAQFQQILFSANSWRTQAFPLVGRVGIGTFPNGTNLPSALTINTNLIPSPTGEVFRTDCPALNTPFWRMFRGGEERARFYNPAATSDLVIETPSKFSNILFNTHNITRVIIKDGLSPLSGGFVGMGNNFYDPKSQLHINDGAFPTYLQITNAGTNPLATDGFKIGVETNGTAVLNQQEDADMLFYTGAIPNNNIRMTINGETGAMQGFVGIGDNFTNPNNLLDVNGGDIDVNTPNRGYMIGDNYVLRHNAIISNIYVGVNAGNGISTAFNNTFVGNLAGNNNTTGIDNTFVGFNAGTLNNAGQWNTFIGSNSGRSNTNGFRNTFVGDKAGRNNTSGYNNNYLLHKQPRLKPC